jgi:hypothetical protein
MKDIAEKSKNKHHESTAKDNAKQKLCTSIGVIPEIG